MGTMNLLQRISSLLQHYNRYSDEVSEKCMYDEYYYLLRLSLFFPSLKSPFIAGIHLLQLIFYVAIILVHLYFIQGTLFRAKPEDFLIASNTAHFGLILFLFLWFIFSANLVRYDLVISHKMIGEGVYIYKNESIMQEEHKLRMKYESIKVKMKTFLPSITILAGVLVVFVGPWIDKLAGSEDTRIYTETGIFLKTPVPIWYPFDANILFVYIICYLGQMLCAFLMCVILASAGYVYFTMIISLIMQYERLIMSVQNLEKRAVMIYKQNRPDVNAKLNRNVIYEDPEFLHCMEFCFRQNIQHHQQILRLLKLISNIVGRPMFAVVVSAGLIMAMSAVVIITGGEKPGIVVATVCVALAEILNVTAMCKVGQIITDLNQSFRNTIYYTPWYKCSKRLCSLISVVVEVTQKDASITAMFNMKANMETYSSILNTAYTYFSLLVALDS